MVCGGVTGQMDYTAYMPLVPTTIRRPIPKRGSKELQACPESLNVHRVRPLLARSLCSAGHAQTRVTMSCCTADSDSHCEPGHSACSLQGGPGHCGPSKH